MRRNFLIFAVLVSISLIIGVATSALAQSPDSNTKLVDKPSFVSPDLTGHQVEYSDNSITITWVTDNPQIGWVEYGSKEDALNNVAYDVMGNEAQVSNHHVMMKGLPLGTTVYYVIVSDGVRNTKGGHPFVAVTNQPAVSTVNAATSEPQPFVNDALGLSFIVPAGWNAQPVKIEGGEDPIIEVGDENGERGSLFIFRGLNPNDLTPEAWFAAHQDDYSKTLTNILGKADVGSAHALIIGELASCDAGSLLLALVGSNGFIYSITYSGVRNRTFAPEFAMIVGSLHFGVEPTTEWQPLSTELATLPPSVQEEACTPVSAAETTAAKRCPGAAMYIPSPGRMGVPWNCYNNDTYCYPYSSNATTEPFTRPHRGLDIFGTENDTPVYATYSGKVFKVDPQHAIRLESSSPYNGKTYYGHMAHSSGFPDYRTFFETSKTPNVTAGALLGKTGNFGTGGAGPHVHVSYFWSSESDFSWPTIDPTQLLSAINLVWYPGWIFKNDPVTCSSSSADSYEPDNFIKTAKKFTVNGAAQRHDFHAPSDEDWVTFKPTSDGRYRIMTSNLASRSDTYVYLYGADGTTQLGENDDSDGSAASRLDISLKKGTTYYVKIKHYSWEGYIVDSSTPMRTYEVSIYGPDTGYDFRIVTLPAAPTGFNSQFNGSAPGWLADSGSWSVDANFLTSLGLANKRSTAYQVGDYSNFDFETVVWRNGCENCSSVVFFRGTPTPLSSLNDWNKGYTVTFTRSGYYALWSTNASTSYPLQNWTFTSALNRGSAWNVVRIVAVGSSIKLYLNGVFVWSGTNTDYTTGKVGLGMYRDGTSGNQIWFDYAKLTPVTAAASLEAVEINAEQQALNKAANAQSDRTGAEIDVSKSLPSKSLPNVAPPLATGLGEINLPASSAELTVDAPESTGETPTQGTASQRIYLPIIESSGGNH